MGQISPVNIRFSPAGQNLVYSPQREKPDFPTLFNKHNKNNNGTNKTITNIKQTISKKLSTSVLL
jgi:hypothetical protein